VPITVSFYGEHRRWKNRVKSPNVRRNRVADQIGNCRKYVAISSDELIKPSLVAHAFSKLHPASASLDLAVSKITRLGGTRRLEARAEIYNLLNRTNLGLPDSFVDHPTFGQSLSAGPGRMAQVAVRFAF